MACSISYINSQPLSNAEKDRLSQIHTDIFTKAKNSGAFRAFDGKLFTLKNAYSSAISFVSGINNEYESLVAKINTKAPGQHYLSVDVLPLTVEKQSEIFNQAPKITTPIIPVNNLRTFDFGDLEGKTQTDAENKAIHNRIINTPDEPMTDEGGETFEQAERRIIPEIQSLVRFAKPNTVVVTHNSVYGVIKLWDQEGRPSTFDKEQRIKYTKQDNTFETGEHFVIKGDNGNIYVVRHGETEDNVNGVFRRKAANLTDNGREQADKVANTLSDIPVSEIVSSPLHRTIETSNIIASKQKSGKQSVASEATLKKVRQLIDKMGIDVQKLSDYAKSTNVDVSGMNGIADITKNIIAIAEGKEADALTEEMVHISTAILEQLNPKMVTEMISKIDRFKIYKETYENYKDTYILPSGKPDIRKIKKEAVDKLITEVIINNNANIDQYPELRQEETQSLVRKWWNSILDFIKGVYRKTNIDIFEQAAKDIMTGATVDPAILQLEGDVFYQKVEPTEKQKAIQSKILATKDSIEKIEGEAVSDPLLLDSEEANSYYRAKQADGNWEKVPHRVTDKVKSWYKQKFGGKTFTPEEKKFNELKRTYGLQGHADFQEIHSRYYNEDGTKREVPLERPEKFNLASQEMYNKLEKYYTEMVNSLPEGTLVFSEIIIYDAKKKEAGTIDFLAVEPSGKTNILDWKFMSLQGEDVPWYKQGAFNIQLGEYKDILKDNYGVKEFGLKRAIPISMEFKKEDKSKDYKLKGIVIGSVDPSKIQDIRLLPVAEETESTGYEELDEIIKKLNGLLKQVGKQKTTDEESRKAKIDRLATLNRAIRVTQVTQNIAPLVDVIEVLRKEGDSILDDYNTIYKDKPADSQDFTNEDLSDFADEMNDFIKGSEMFVDITDNLSKIITPEDDDEMSPEERELRTSVLNKLDEESKLIRRSRKDIIKASVNFADKHIGQKNLVTGLTKAEKVLKGLGSIFRGVSELPLKSLEVLYKLVREAQGKASEDSLNRIKELMNIRNKLSKRGGGLRKLVSQLYQKDDKGNLANRLIDKYQPEFRKTVDEKAKEGGDLQWLKDNINIEAYKKEAKIKIDKLVEKVKSNRYAGTEEEEDQRKENEIKKIKRQYDIDRPDFNGWDNYIIKKHPLDKWYSEEYKNILKDSELLELYNLIIKVNEEAKDLGYINNIVYKTFLPFVRKSMVEELAFDGSISALKHMEQAVQLRADDVGYGNINQITGELENSIPKYFTHDFTYKDGVNDYSEVSEDLFKNLIVYIQHVQKYKYLSQVEGQLKLIKTLETFKGHLNTTKTGKIVRKDGKIEEIPGNEENAKTFDDFFRVLLYDQKYVLSDSDTPLHFDKAINAVKKAVNTVAGKEIWKPTDPSTPSSMLKTIDAMNRGFQLKTLGFEFISGAVNWFGGNLQMATQSGNYFKAREFAKNESKLVFQRFENKEDRELFIQLVDTFMPLKDDPSYELYKSAGMHTLTQNNLGDILMVFMRKPEHLIEKSVFLSLLQNTMVEDGKIVSIREFVNNKYKDKFDTPEKYYQSKDKIESEVEELKNTKSINATKKLVDGKLVIPGLNLSDRKEIQRLTDLTRRISRNVTGGMSDGDINKMSMSIWTKSMMIFKNWIPKLADTRFSEFRKVSDDFSVRIGEDGISEGEKYDIGRLRLLGYVLTFNVFKGVRDLKNILYLNQSGLDKLDDMFEEFKQKYEEDNGELLNITREQFIDLIRNNLRNQIKELAILFSLFGIMLSLGFMAPDDDDDKASKNFHRYSQRVVDKFINEISFFYNPASISDILSGGVFPAIGMANDASKFMKHFWLQTTGMDFDPNTSYEDVLKKAQPIKYAMKMAPVTKSLVTYLAIFNEDFAKDYDVTISKQSSR